MSWPGNIFLVVDIGTSQGDTGDVGPPTRSTPETLTARLGEEHEKSNRFSKLGFVFWLHDCYGATWPCVAKVSLYAGIRRDQKKIKKK